VINFAAEHPLKTANPSNGREVLAAAVILTLVAGENLTVGSTVWLPAESMAPGRWFTSLGVSATSGGAMFGRRPACYSGTTWSTARVRARWRASWASAAIRS